MFGRIFQHWALAIILVTGGLQAAKAADRIALVIGNNNYENLTTLNNPGFDAERMAAVLAEYGFKVMSCDGERLGCFDLGRSELNDALEDFEEEADGADVALVFYAGHGLQTAEGNVLAPVDMEISCDNWKAKHEVLLDDVLEAMVGAREKIVILDACRNDPFRAQQCLSRGARALSFGTFAVPNSVSRFLLITSTLNGQVAQDGAPGQHSPFAEALFHWMEAEPRIQFQQMFSRVAKRVIERTTAANFTQVPEILIRGGAPDACISAENCGVDPQAELLRREIDMLTEENRRNQELAAIGAAYLRATGIEEGRELSEEERQRILREIGGATRELASRNDAEGERALAALKEGNEAEAERLFEEVISASAREAEEAAQAAAARRAEANQKAADAARHIAALARPKDVVKAAKYYLRATDFQPDDYQTWMDLASVSIDIGNTSQALQAYRKASAIARDNGSLSDRYWAANGQGDIVLAQGRHERALKFYEAASKLAEEMVNADPTDLDAERNLSVSQNRIGDVLLVMGDLTGAREAFSEGLVIAEGLVKKQPDYDTWKRDLSVSNERLGNVLKAQGDLSGALEQYQASYDRMKPISDANPDDNDLKRFVMVTLNKIGDIRIAQLDLEGALETYTKGMEIAEHLVAFDPGNAGWQRDLAISDERIGDIHADKAELDGTQKQFHLEKAMEHYQKSFDRITPLRAADPDNLGLARFQSVSLNKIGDVYNEQGKEENALEAYLKGQEIVESLIAAEPNNFEWKSDLTISYERVADSYVDLGRADEALEVYQKNLELARDLAASDPTNVERQWGLYVALWRIADNTAEKVKHFQEALVLLEKLHAEGRLAPNRLEWIETTRQRLSDARDGGGDGNQTAGGDRKLSDRYWELNGEGDVFLAQGRLQQALDSYKAAYEVAEDMVAADYTDLDAERNLSVSLNRIGDVLIAMGDLNGARKSFSDGLVIAEVLVKKQPDNEGWKRDLSISNERLGNVLKSQGDIEGALEQYMASFNRMKPIVDGAPDDNELQRFNMVTLNKIGDIKMLKLDLKGALDAYSKGKEIAERLIAANPSNTGWQRDMAVSHERVGDVYAEQGKLDEAMEQYQASYDRITPLREADPDNLGLKRFQSVTLNKIGDVYVEKDDTESALEAYEDSRSIMETLTQAEPGNLEWKGDLTIALERVADSYVKLGRAEEALEVYRENLNLAESLATADPTNVERQWGLYVALWRIADNTDEKVEYFSRALDVLEKMNAMGTLAPNRVEWIETTRERLEEAQVAGQ